MPSLPTIRRTSFAFRDRPEDDSARFLARTLWLQGFPDQAMRTAESSIENARAANHAVSLCYALALAACPIALPVGDVPAAEHYARMLREHSTRYALVR